MLDEKVRIKKEFLLLLEMVVSTPPPPPPPLLGKVNITIPATRREQRIREREGRYKFKFWLD
jgi:hypothetical protein